MMIISPSFKTDAVNIYRMDGFMAALNLSKVRFTHKSDVVNPGKEIYNSRFSYVDTSKGDDQIIGTSNVTGDFALGAYVKAAGKNRNAIASADLNGEASIATYGIKNEGVINTNDGSDIVRGRATANITATAETVSVAIATAQRTDATAFASAFADLNVKATADGIDNSWGVLYTGKGSDSVSGDTEGSISAVAVATLDASAIVEAICKAPESEGLTAFAQAMAISLAEGTITATGIKNFGGIIATGKGDDTLTASATSSAGTFSGINFSAFASATPNNQALAEAVANASAKATDKAIAIDNSRGWIDTGTGDDTIEATAKAIDKAIAIENSRGWISTGFGNDSIIAKATGADTYGIYGGNIDTGKGSDRIVASSFGGGININLGEDNDFIQGFGNARVDGGQGWDTISFGSYNQDDFQISLGANNNRVSFQLDGISMTTTGFEQFNFANGSYSFDQLKPA
ncbi:hypothetical protein NIES2100_42960 [Calothrix sp. NIES-2100]|uniref:hypothetical protein n=1 Tax=Calothrix sp. NIES-2100 TaxID=1954172 RepID=UPI000B5E630C|nr:hypothetical protein NIES2100_42960 [Calothrix sp. NIES-2100]